MDELFVGGEEPGLRGGRQKGKKVLVGCAVEHLYPKGFGRTRMAVLPDASTESLAAFLADHVEPGTSLITHGWSAYPAAAKDNYYHVPIVGQPEKLPGVHRATSLLKRWLLSTHQGSVDREHLPAYLNEFVFRFNRRNSRRRGLLFLRALEMAVAHEPVRYRDLVLSEGTTRTVPKPRRPGRGPTSVERATANRPWRQPPLTCPTPVKSSPQRDESLSARVGCLLSVRALGPMLQNDQETCVDTAGALHQ
jgi:transposase-like protein